MKLKAFFQYVTSLPKSIYFNMRVFDFKTACRLPILVGVRVKIKDIHKGSVEIPSGHFPMFGIKLGVTRIGGKSRRTHSRISIAKGGKIIFKGICRIYHGFGIVIGKNGKLQLGNDFFANDDFYCLCEKGITIGDNAHIGWNTSYRDHDGHEILSNGEVINSPKEVIIGNHVWICTDVSILKGVSIPDETVIAQGSLVTKSFDESGTILAGSPAQVFKKNITWRI